MSVTDLPPRVPYDPPKAKNLMVECEKNVNFARMTEAPDNWEENIVKYDQSFFDFAFFGIVIS